jgi:hypothetical protein
MSSRMCPDWPQLLEAAPELQFKHYTLGEAHLPADAVVHLEGVPFDEVSICCDLDRHVFNPQHTDARIATALGATHWFDLREWIADPRHVAR